MTISAAVRPHERMSDTELVGALRRGDELAFHVLCERHQPALRRYAAGILRSAVADDVVQESLLRAHRAFLRDDRHLAVKPYLFRVVRNCCLDELARVRTDSVPLHVLYAHEEPAGGDSPHALLERRQRVQSTLADLAALPDNQRHALVRREVDGLTHEQVAAELGVSLGASKNLVFRARETLTQVQAARNARCEDVRHELLQAHDAKRRASVHALRHAAGCSGCRSFRSSLKAGRRAMAILLPGPVLGALIGGGVVSASKPVALKTAAVGAAAALAAGGALELHAQVFRPGDRTPVAVDGVALPGGHLARGGRVPSRVALVTRRVQLPARSSGPPTATSLSCPGSTRVAGLVPMPGLERSHGFDEHTLVGVSRGARIVFAPLDAAQTAQVAILCRTPDGRGSVRAAPARPRGEPTVHSCRARAALRGRPGRAAAGTVTAGQPLAVLASRGRWLRVRTDGGTPGWIHASIVC